MNEILQKQLELLALIRLNHHGVHPNKYGLQFFEKGVVIDYIKDHAFFMDEEVTEILLAIGNGNKAIYKPWCKEHKDLTAEKFETNESVRSEAIDMLCFCLNICLAVGITPENINEEYDKVWRKNVKRQSTDY